LLHLQLCTTLVMYVPSSVYNKVEQIFFFEKLTVVSQIYTTLELYVTQNSRTDSWTQSYDCELQRQRCKNLQHYE
jgi:predicted DNA-binding protein (UPF0278 family)